MPRSRLVLVLSIALFLPQCLADSGNSVQPLIGVVSDPTGAVIAGATVQLLAGSSQLTARTDSAGHFQVQVGPVTSGTLTVSATGFVSQHIAWNGENHLTVVLQPGLDSAQQVLVTATRIDTQLDDAPADSVMLTRENIATTPALALDDMLRKLPGFTLFRRTSSRVSNPTSQGASLRGLGASGSSRALVLVDEVPLNDPFGGWVYWDRTARESLNSVEVVRGGGGASLYGTTAMGGVIQFRTREPETTALSVDTSLGNELTPALSLWAGTRAGPWYGSVASDLFRTDGYFLVPECQRGSVDTRANSSHELVTVDLGRHFGDASRVFARGSYFDEARENGTVIQTNTTQLADFSTGWNYDKPAFGNLSARFFGLFESYRQTFSAVQAGRDSETLTNVQRVPSQSLGGNAQWSRPLGRIQTLVAGFEMREVHGSSNEVVSVGTNLNGGRQRATRIFGEDILQLTPRFLANLSFGYDHWSDFDARSIQIRQSGVTVNPFPQRSSDALNPRASLLYRIGHGTSLTASGYRAFRAPTLNELYRSFRQGNTLTQANAALKAERLTGAEGGVRQTLLSERLNLRATFFWNDVTNAIVNVTLTQDASLTTRQRQNISRTLSTGLNLDGEWRVNNAIQIAGAYQYTHAVVASYNPDPSVQVLNPSLVDKWIPEIPHQQFTLQTRYVNPKYLTATVQGTFVGGQFDDDLNTLLLGRYFTVDVYASRSLGKGFEAYVAAENLLDQTYDVALTPQGSGPPLRNVGSPILVRVGLHYQFPGR